MLNYRYPISLAEFSNPTGPHLSSGKIHHTPGNPPRKVLEFDERHALHPRHGEVILVKIGSKPEWRMPNSLQTNSALPRISGWSRWREEASEPLWDNTPCFVVGRNTKNFPRVSFFPHDGLGAGVAMGLAFYGEGMVLKESSIELCLPPHVRDVESLPLLLLWPGYMHIKIKRSIYLIDPETGHHVTYGRIAQQVSGVFSDFINHFGDKFDASESGIQLGPKAVTLHKLRLLQVYVPDDCTLRAEISYTRRN
ncbi:hypothetical protein DFH07DRAFT_1017923 [Mycena maculata]|uniref:Uncharacterized protein n=1 Tax=Mycena maculata TaxID=230809 RepID=A0AAD7KFA9_9AGAR|nr:hypothetical protein DFH07DRAFT_1017923 [Mycena maculata]